MIIPRRGTDYFALAVHYGGGGRAHLPSIRSAMVGSGLSTEERRRQQSFSIFDFHMSKP
jgi:hypothetical protein